MSLYIRKATIAITPPRRTATSQRRPRPLSLERNPEDVDEPLLELGLLPGEATELGFVFEKLVEAGLLPEELKEVVLLPGELIELGWP